MSVQPPGGPWRMLTVRSAERWIAAMIRNAARISRSWGSPRGPAGRGGGSSAAQRPRRWRRARRRRRGAFPLGRVEVLGEDDVGGPQDVLGDGRRQTGDRLANVIELAMERISERLRPRPRDDLAGASGFDPPMGHGCPLRFSTTPPRFVPISRPTRHPVWPSSPAGPGAAAGAHHRRACFRTSARQPSGSA